MTQVKKWRRGFGDKGGMTHACSSHASHPHAHGQACGSEPAGHSCASHLREVAGTRNVFRARLPDGHVLATFMDEHVRILAHLDRLEILALRVAASSDRGPGSGAATAMAEMGRIATHLIGAEPHHQREEEVLFPALEHLGIGGPPAVMRSEHVELRRLKHAVQDLANGADAQALVMAARGLVEMLREHIAKEDNVLYPMAFELLRDERQWTEMRTRCDAIGYCCGGHA